MAATKSTPAKKAVEPVPAKKAMPAGRTVHLLINTDENGAIRQVENFTAELAARRELDNRPSWQYLGVQPGSVWTANELGGVSTDG